MNAVDAAIFGPPIAAIPFAILMAAFMHRRYPDLPPRKVADRAAWPGPILICLGYWSILFFLPTPSPEVASHDQPMMIRGLILVGAPINAFIIFVIGWAVARATLWVRSRFLDV